MLFSANHQESGVRSCDEFQNVIHRNFILSQGKIFLSGRSKLYGLRTHSFPTYVHINPFTLRAAKRGLTILEIFPLQKHFLKTFEREMLIRRQTTNLHQIFCEISFRSQVIFKSMKVADNISRGTLECEWVKQTCKLRGLPWWLSVYGLALFTLNTYNSHIISLCLNPHLSKWGNINLYFCLKVLTSSFKKKIWLILFRWKMYLSFVWSQSRQLHVFLNNSHCLSAVTWGSGGEATSSPGAHGYRAEECGGNRRPGTFPRFRWWGKVL